MIGKTIMDRASGTPAMHEYCCLLSDLMMLFDSIYYKQYGPRSGHVRIQKGGQGVRTPPEKSQKYRVS